MQIVIFSVLCFWLASAVVATDYIGVLVDTSEIRRQAQASSAGPTIPQPVRPSNYGNTDGQEAPGSLGLLQAMTSKSNIPQKVGSSNFIGQPPMPPRYLARPPQQSILSPKVANNLVNTIVDLSLRPDGRHASPDRVRHAVTHMSADELDKLFNVIESYVDVDGQKDSGFLDYIDRLDN